ncbi:MAG: proton-translocating NADH-quinone oxidoreductase, chain [Ilumatobacteraceae bacterium]|nr:proton-translocating NADH-quinone oxidoreductase, chain [Ilumatobacteraceae bacterium]
MLTHVWIIPLIPALSFVAILAIGKRLPKKGAEIGIASVAICLVLALATGTGWISRVNHPPESAHAEATAQSVEGHEAEATATASATEGEPAASADAEHAEGGAEAEEHHVTPPVQRNVTWFETGDVTVKAGTLIDGLSALMLVIVTFISLLVHVFSTDYVGGDRRETHYFAFLSLFTAAMLFYVISDNTLQMVVGWELVGLCSFALIGHWWEEKPNSDAALKAFLTNRVGDIGLLVGVIILYFAAGKTFDVLSLNTQANAGLIEHNLLLIGSLCLITAVMSKSGQFVLHTWLPDAMAGPTPVSALIHAATMVVAGIYLVARNYGVFFNGLSIGTANVNALAVVGCVTLLFGAFLAFVQTDIKKVLAYSTVSQLGYMVTALGVGGWTAAIFHLFTHAIFKACLFLGSGSLAHHIHSFDMKKDMGGMRKRMPITFWTFLIGTAALMGLPLITAGFWSKDEILAGAHQLGGDGGYRFAVIMGLMGAVCTCAYMTRAIWYVFYGEPRGKSAEHDLHENGPRITVPLIILATGSILVGYANLPEKVFGIGVPESLSLRFEHFIEPTGAYFPSADNSFSHPEFVPWIALVSALAIVIGAGGAYLWYFKDKGPHGITERNKVARTGYKVLENKYYLDWLYTDVIVGFVKGPFARATNWFNQNILDGVVNSVGKGARGAGEFVYHRIDQGVVDNVVKGSGLAAEGSGSVLRKTQNGKVQWYAAYLFLGATILAAIFVIVAS